MARLEELVPGARVAGLDPAGPVTITGAEWHGDAVLKLAWRDGRGRSGGRLAYRWEEPAFSLQGKGLPWRFDADGAAFRLVSEAWRIHYAHLFDPYLAVHTSDVSPLPHQIAAVYQEMLPRLPLRYVLADDPGAGKTIMTGLFIRELIARGDLGRCLIVCPGSLAGQWQEELWRKFQLSFTILTSEMAGAAGAGGVFAGAPLMIARLDMLARSEALKKALEESAWDLVVCDEAHKMSASVFGGELKTTRRFQLGRLLSRVSRHFLLLTATPHNGKEEDFQQFLSLLDGDRFGAGVRAGSRHALLSDVMRRLVKEELRKFDGSPLFPGRHAVTLAYDLSPAEMELYEAVTGYVRTQFSRAERLVRKRRITVGFALTVLQRRLASSPEAIWQSLRRRRERLEARLADGQAGRWAPEDEAAGTAGDVSAEEDFSAREREEMEERLAGRASAARTLEELEAEVAALRGLERLAGAVRASGADRKWEELSGLLQEEAFMFDSAGEREKLIIFTEHRDTLLYLAGKIRSLLGSEEAALTIHGGMSRAERVRAEKRFMQDGQARVLVATDAAGEGLNLQRAHLMVNYDLPWNPNRLEQRFGRIHRIGQDKACRMWNLVADKTREGAVFRRLFEKLDQEKAALGGKVFDILGKVAFNNRPLRELLIEAVRDDAPDEAALGGVIDAAFEREALASLLREQALASDCMDAKRIAVMREEMERMEARRLQPHFIEAFFREAFRALGGRMIPREPGRHEISFVPAALRGGAPGREPPLERYERVCFELDRRDGDIPADILCPGHPLLDAVLAATRERGGSLLRRGAILIDENDPGERCRLLLYVESALRDGVTLPDGAPREISRQVYFMERDEGGFSVNAGPAPYLDFRPAAPEEKDAILAHAAGLSWLGADVEAEAIRHAEAAISPRHLQEAGEPRRALLERTKKAVSARLGAEIQRLDFEAGELERLEKGGRPDARRTSAQLASQAERLAERRARRLEELERESEIAPLPPRVTGGALVAPGGLLERLLARDAGSAFCADAEARGRVERAAMSAVMALERRLGYAPRDVSAEKRGYDIESAVPERLRSPAGERLRFLEVKGRAKGADTVTVTRNEMLAALNRPEQFILALVEVDGGDARVTYLKRPFTNPPDFSVQAATFSIPALLTGAEVVLEA